MNNVNIKYLDRKIIKFSVKPGENININLLEPGENNKIFKNYDEFIINTPSNILEHMNNICDNLSLGFDKNDPNEYLLYDLYFLEKCKNHKDSNLNQYLYEFCEIKNIESYSNYIYNKYIINNSDIKDIKDETDLLFEIKNNYDLTVKYDDYTNDDYKCINFLCNFIHKEEYNKYKKNN